MKRRKSKAVDDYPMPWERRPVEYERWMRHRERMMASHPEGARPCEWWAYESPVARPNIFGPRECRVLYEIGELSAEEIAILTPQWRAEFDKAQEAGFKYRCGPNKFLEGPAAQRAWYRWAGIPRELITKWTKDHARHSRTIRKLAKVADATPRDLADR